MAFLYGERKGDAILDVLGLRSFRGRVAESRQI